MGVVTEPRCTLFMISVYVDGPFTAPHGQVKRAAGVSGGADMAIAVAAIGFHDDIWYAYPVSTLHHAVNIFIGHRKLEHSQVLENRPWFNILDDKVCWCGTVQHDIGVGRRREIAVVEAQTVLARRKATDDNNTVIVGDKGVGERHPNIGCTCLVDGIMDNDRHAAHGCIVGHGDSSADLGAAELDRFGE